MIKVLTSVFMLACMFLCFSTGVKAENKLTAPFKAPFSIFGSKKDKDKESSQQLDANAEKNVQTTPKQKPIIVYDSKNTLGVTYLENAVSKAEFYIEEKDFESAKQVLEEISEWVYDATEYHTDLFKTLSNLENSEEQANIERNLAIQFAVLRDKTLFLESRIHLENGDKKQAIENLVEVVRSQPSTELGFKAYESLQEIGFTYKIEYEMIDE